MKKIFMGLAIAAAAAAGLTSCGGGNKSYTADEQQLGDSIALALGQFAGAQQNMQFDRIINGPDSVMASKFNKADFLRGLQTALNADTTQLAYIQGLQMGVQLLQPIMGINNEAKLPVDKDAVVAAFKEIFMADSLQDAQQYYGRYQMYMGKIRERMDSIARVAKENSPEAKKNLADGQAFAAKKATEAGYTKAPSGIIYKIDQPGEGNKVQPSDRVKINYKGSHINGEVFDQTHDTPYESSARAFIPGFNEALGMLAKGGKMTVVIPADQGYGVDGAGNAVGPNETLVFDIEVVDVTPVPAAGNPSQATLK